MSSATLNSTATLNSAAGESLVGVLGLLAIAGLIFAGIALALASTRYMRAYRWARRLGQAVNQAAEYAMKGVLTAVVLLVGSAPAISLVMAEQSTREAVGRWAFGFLAGLAVLVGLGWLGDRAYTALKQGWEERRQELDKEEENDG